MHEHCISNSPIPLTKNKAKAKLRSIIGKIVSDELNVKLNNKMIKPDDLSYFFDHEEGGYYYMKPEYVSKTENIITCVIHNQNNFSFLK